MYILGSLILLEKEMKRRRKREEERGENKKVNIPGTKSKQTL